MKTILEIEPGYTDALREAGLTDFDAFMRAAAGPTTSNHKNRSTAPLDIVVDGAAKRFFLKRNFRVPPRHALAPLLGFRAGFSQPRREWQILGKLHEAGIPAMRRVAMGERRVAGLPVAAFLLVEAVPMCHTLENWLVPGFEKPRLQLDGRQRSCLMFELGRQFGMLLHGQGFRWPDIHPKHVFAQPSPTPRKWWTWDFCFIDVERMEASETPGIAVSSDLVPIDESAIEDLRRFVRNLRPMNVSRLDILRLWAGYCFCQRWEGQHPKRNPRRGPQWNPAWIRIDELPRLPDDFEHPRSLSMVRSKRMMVDARASALLQSAGLNSIADVFAYQPADLLSKPDLKAHRDRSRLHLQNGKGPPMTVYLKRYRRPPLMEQIHRIQEVGVGLSNAAREMKFIKKLAELGVPTMKIVAFGQEMSGPWERRSFALTEAIDGISLEKLLIDARKNPARVPSWANRREIIRQLGLLVRLLHRHKLFHRDLYLCHVFLTRNADGGIVLRVIDLARMIAKPLRPRRWGIKDLASLEYSAPVPLVTRTDRLRFLKIYHGEKASKKMLTLDIAEVTARVKRISRHDSHRTARLQSEALA